jgi:hypothetical protein
MWSAASCWEMKPLLQFFKTTLFSGLVIVPMQQLAAKFLMTMKEYQPSQTPGSFNLEKIQKMIEAGAK